MLNKQPTFVQVKGQFNGIVSKLNSFIEERVLSCMGTPHCQRFLENGVEILVWFKRKKFNQIWFTFMP
jgi:hypothetical protein